MDNNISAENQIEPQYEESKPRKYASGKYKLDVFDWMKQYPTSGNTSNIVEVRFKNTRKDYYENTSNLTLEAGDIVAVEASPGHDIGVVSLTGDLVLLQLKKNGIVRPKEGFKKIYRKARVTDIEKWDEAKALEHETMIKARQISKDLNLDMKIGDVEYQGDKTKAIFYYIAEERVDFRELIKVLAEKFKVRIEMRQIGARQEAGRIGGIGSCGNELCCASFISKFVSVTTNAARYQELSLNPQKLAGQCSKLKCCLNFEVDSYIDAQRNFPPTNIPLEYKGGKAYHNKTDVYKRTMCYATQSEAGSVFIDLPVERVRAIIEMNKNGIIPEELLDEQDNEVVEKELDFDNVVGQESLTRFDDKNRKKKKKKKRSNGNSQNVVTDNRTAENAETDEVDEKKSSEEVVEESQNIASVESDEQEIAAKNVADEQSDSPKAENQNRQDNNRNNNQRRRNRYRNQNNNQNNTQSNNQNRQAQDENQKSDNQKSEVQNVENQGVEQVNQNNQQRQRNNQQRHRQHQRNHNNGNNRQANNNKPQSQNDAQ